MSLRHRLRSPGAFTRDRSGSVAMVFAVSAVPMLLLMGAAVDYTRAVTKRTSLQQATDATALAVAHDLAQGLSQTVIVSDTQKYFAAAVGDANAYIDSGPTVSSDNTTVCLTARSRVPTMLISVGSSVGLSPLSQVIVAATSCSKINNTGFEIALALDNSGSMNEATSGTTKMVSLQSATQQLISIMDPTGQVPKASFSLVPFSSAVNIGSGYASASFMDRSGASSIHWQNFQLPAAKYNIWVPTSKFDLFTYSGVPWGGCVEERPAPYTTTDTAASAGTPDTLFVPYLWPDEGTSSLSAYRGLQPLNSYYSSTTAGYCSTGTQANAGRYADADAPNNTIAVTNTVTNTLKSDSQTMVCKYRGQSTNGGNSAFVDTNGNALKAGPNLLCSSQPITTLTNNVSALNSSVSAMTANGDTNLIGGFMWAWRTISPLGPFGTQPTVALGNQNPKTYAALNNKKIIILMTDGFNHWASSTSAINTSAYSSLGYFANARLGSTTTASNYRGMMDASTLQACTNAKAAGVQIYTVGFSIPSDPIDQDGLNLLQNCASQPSMAYIAQDGTALIATFKSIANNLSGLRLVN